MKFFLCLVLLLTACGEAPVAQEEKAPSPEELNNELPVFSKSDFKKGRQLMTSQDCLACHLARLVPSAPSQAMLAARYEKMSGATLQEITKKVILGYRGEHSFAGMGEAEALMPPHPQLTPSQAELLVRTLIELGK